MTRPSAPTSARQPRGRLARCAGLGARGLSLTGLMLGLGACQAVDNGGTAGVPQTRAAAAAASSPGTAERLAAVRARLETALAKASACTADAQCRSVAVGAKACGGPAGYRAFATQPADPRVVEDLASQERDLSLAEARESGRVSPCFVVADPGARCVRSRCETRPGLEPPDSGAAIR